jgi:hypothetical protein
LWKRTAQAFVARRRSSVTRERLTIGNGKRKSGEMAVTFVATIGRLIGLPIQRLDTARYCKDNAIYYWIAAGGIGAMMFLGVILSWLKSAF